MYSFDFMYKITANGNNLSLYMRFFDGFVSMTPEDSDRLRAAISILSQRGIVDHVPMLANDLSVTVPMEDAHDLLVCFRELQSAGFLNAKLAEEFLAPLTVCAPRYSL